MALFAAPLRTQHWEARTTNKSGLSGVSLMWSGEVPCLCHVSCLLSESISMGILKLAFNNIHWNNILVNDDLFIYPSSLELIFWTLNCSPTELIVYLYHKPIHPTGKALNGRILIGYPVKVMISIRLIWNLIHLNTEYKLPFIASHKRSSSVQSLRSRRWMLFNDRRGVSDSSTPTLFGMASSYNG